MKAELAAARAADAERRAAADEEDRLRRHAELMALYDTMTPEEIQEYGQMRARIRNRIEDPFKDSPLRQQPLAPGPPRVYDLRGDPTAWQLPSPPPSPPPVEGPSHQPKTPPSAERHSNVHHDGPGCRCPACLTDIEVVNAAGQEITMSAVPVSRPVPNGIGPSVIQGTERVQEKPASPIPFPL